MDVSSSPERAPTPPGEVEREGQGCDCWLEQGSSGPKGSGDWGAVGPLGGGLMCLASSEHEVSAERLGAVVPPSI